MFELAQQYYKSGNFEHSIDIYTTLITQEPHNVELYYQRALCFVHLKKYSNALEDLTMTIELEPHHPFRYSSRAYVKASMGNVLGAIDDYKMAICLDPDDAIAHNNLGLLEEQLGRMSEAKKLFRKADMLAGVKSISHISEQEPKISEKFTFKHYLHTISEVFSSKTTFFEFCRFIFTKNKLNK